MKTLREKLKTDLVLLDGAFGTYAEELGLKQEDFEDRPGCLEYLSLVRPDFVARIHTDYLASSADAIETNTFGANEIKLIEYGLADRVYEINLEATRLARKAADKFSTQDFPRYVVGTMGPTGKLPSAQDPDLGNITYDELKRIYHEQALGIIDGGADAILIETSQDLLEMKAAVNGAKKAIHEKKKPLVLMAHCTLANSGRMLLGTEVSSVMATLAYLGVDVIGLNCSTGPQEMESTISFLAKYAPTYISCLPNAGLPIESDGKVTYPLKPKEMARLMTRFVEKYNVDVIGGCCGTTPLYIQEMRALVKKIRKRTLGKNHFYASFYNAFDLKTIERPIKVGERLNTQGSKRMKELLKINDYDSLIELGKKEENSGAQILDVCSVLTERESERQDMVILIKALSESVRTPLMIDSTSLDVVKAALEVYAGTAFINSVNLEDGGKRARKVFELAKEHASFVVCLLIDENGMAKTIEEKLETAERLYNLAAGEYKLEPHRLLFDMLTFTLGTGENEYLGAAINTFEAIKRFKKQHPDILTVLGVSNISFGLSKTGRKILNMVFLHHAVRSGLDIAIINPEEFIEYRLIPKKECALAEDVLFNKKPDALNRFIEYFSKLSKVGAGSGRERDNSSPPDHALRGAPAPTKELTIEARLKACVLDRDKSSIIPLIDEARKKYTPEEIIDNILMDAMKEVGQRLDSGEMVLPFVLQSAEVMRKAIEYLGQFLHIKGIAKRGKVLLATVFGDVHDIGKNLVKLLLENNGFSVIDLGKQVPVERIIEEAKRNEVDAVGLSALLVSTARYMKLCVQSMHDANLLFPVLVGGAPINKEFTKDISKVKDQGIYKGGVFYAKDAFTGLKIMQALMDVGKREETLKAYYKQFEGQEKCQSVKVSECQSGVLQRTTNYELRTMNYKPPTPPFFGIKSLSNISLDDVFPYLDESVLFNLAWGAKREDECKVFLSQLKEECIRKAWLDLKAVYGYFKCRALDEDMEVLDESGKVVLERIHFPRSEDAKHMSLADYFSKENRTCDLVIFQAVTVGEKINDAITKLNEEKEVAKSFLLHGLSTHLAEALAAYIHDIIREELNLKKSQGKRYSPGYPLWRNLEDQKKIFRLLDIERRLGVKLTEAYQMVPEQSTTAMVVYNDRAKY